MTELELAHAMSEAAEAIERGYPLKAHVRAVIANYLRTESRFMKPCEFAQRLTHALHSQGR